MKPFVSCFAERLSAYVGMRRNLGCVFQLQAYILGKFDRYAFEHGHQGPLTSELVFDFATANADVSPFEQARRYQVLRNFANYLAVYEPATPVLDPLAVRAARTRPPAHIYSGAELDQLLTEARQVSHRHPIRGVTLHAMVGLAASSGLRVGEVVRLDRADVDLETGVLSIRQTKFAKDRLVPVHPSTLDVLRRYAALRDAYYHDVECPAFFINLRKQRYSRHTLECDFWHLGRRTGLRGSKGAGPRFHDLRHTFAVRRLVAWYKEGADVQAMLPVLATYMGHVHYSDTAYYLQATAELLGLAADRFQQSLAAKEDGR